jgi:hypothetical protein
MVDRAAEHPIWRILVHQRRSIRWLASTIRRSENLIYQIKMGTRPATPAVREACAEALGIPADLLFHPDRPIAESERIEVAS